MKTIEYPVYVEHALGLRKIEGPETYISVNNDFWEEGIVRMSKARNVIDTMLANGTKVSEACFNNAFQSALTKLNIMALDQIIPEGKEVF